MDRAALRNAFRFLRDEDECVIAEECKSEGEGEHAAQQVDGGPSSHTGSARAPARAPEWADRMARRFEETLFKEYVVADFSRCSVDEPGKNLGLRWRTVGELERGKGETICGNLSCVRTRRLVTVEVPFRYKDEGDPEKTKLALCKLSVCTRCLPLLMAQEPTAAAQDSKRKSTEPGISAKHASASAADADTPTANEIRPLRDNKRSRR